MTDRLQYQPHLALVALDEMSLYFQATLTRVWSPIGQPPVVRISPQRDHIHFYGGVELRAGRELAVTSLEQTAETTADFLRLVLLAFPTQPLLLLLDRAPWHHGPAIDLVLDENPRLTLVYFPRLVLTSTPRSMSGNTPAMRLDITTSMPAFPP